MTKKIVSWILVFTLLMTSLIINASAEYSIYKSDGETYKNNTYINGNDTAIIFVPGYRCTNLEKSVDINKDGDKEKIVTFAIGSEVFEVSDDKPLILNIFSGIVNILVSGVMLLTAELRDEDVHISDDGGFGLADIYLDFFNNCIERYGDTCDILIYDYDWRQELSITTNDLYNIIQEQDYKKVIMVTQSMGGLIASGTAKLIWDDSQHGDKNSNIDIYTVNVGSTFLGGFRFFHNKESFKGIKKLTPAHLKYISEISFPGYSQLSVPIQAETLYGRKYATAKIEKADGSVVYEDITAEDAFEALKNICVSGDYLQQMQDFYDNYVFIDNDNDPKTKDVHIMEELGSDCYYIAGLSPDTPSYTQINFIEDENGKRTAIDCTTVRDENPTIGDGDLFIESSTMNNCSPDTTFYVPYGHKEVYFHDDSQHLMYDILTHLVNNPNEKFDYTDTDYKYTEIYTNPEQYREVESDNLLYPQIVKYILGLLGIDVEFESARNFCHKLFSIFD